MDKSFITADPGYVLAILFIVLFAIVLEDPRSANDDEVDVQQSAISTKPPPSFQWTLAYWQGSYFDSQGRLITLTETPLPQGKHKVVVQLEKSDIHEMLKLKRDIKTQYSLANDFPVVMTDMKDEWITYFRNR